jgi:gliding motility-associated-like protein
VATRLALRDLNKDGKPEITVSNSFNDVFYIFVNQSSGGTLSFNPTPIKLSVKAFASDPSTTNYEAEVQDFDGDELPDLVINEFQDDSLHVFRNTSAGSISFAPRVSIATTEKLNRLSSADINKDGKPDLLCTSTLNNKVLVFLNQSSGGSISFASPIGLATSNGAWGLDVSDIDGDKDPDIVNANRDQSIINIFTHNGNFASPGFTRVDFTSSNPTRNIKVSDMDGDGKPDIIFTAFNTTVTPNTSTLQIVRNTNCHKPEILNAKPVVVCNGQTIQLKTIAANNITYAWTKDGSAVGGNSPYLTITAPGAAGSYIVTASGESGACVVTTAALTVTEDTGAAPPNPAINANTPLCSGSQLQLSTPAVGGGGYTWMGPNGFTSTLQNPVINGITQDASGLYSLQVNVGVCKSNLITKRVDVADLADFTISSNNTTNKICQGSNAILTINTPANHTYQWKKDGSNISGATNSTLTVALEGNYSVLVTNTTLNCSKEAGPVTVTVLQTPTAAYQVKSAACTGEQIVFTDQSQVDSRATVVRNWNFGDATTSTANNPTKTFNTAQTFNTSLTVTYSGVSACSSTVSKPVAVAASVQPVINATATSLCPADQTTLSLAGTFASILWSNAATTSSTIVTGPATYSVTTTDANGCPGQDDIVITAKPVPVLSTSATPATIPSGATSQLLAEGADTYAWLPAETLDNPAIANPKASPTETTTYTVTGSITGGCSVTADVIVTVEGVLGFPVVFSPNGDGMNDIWNIHAQDKPDCTLNIFDGKGRRIFENRGVNWDGTYSGSAVPNGTYYYVFGCPNEKPVTGSVLIIR